MIHPLRGMKDILFDESRRFLHILSVATETAKRYGYGYIETPILEETTLFKRSVGDSSDIVNKEMYRFIDKGEHDVCMRPEGTAGVVRAFISAKLDRQPGKYRFYYHGPMFRYERPQKGRLREFHQFGCESFGEASVYEDFTLIAMVNEILQTLGIDATLKINSLGCEACMPPYREKLSGFLEAHRADLCEDCQRRIETNPIRTLDCKNAHCQTVLQEAPKLNANLCASCQEDMQKLQALLKQADIDFEIDPHLVRGLDYYNKTAFEFTSDALGAQSAVAGGGRYDKLVSYLDGKATPAVGFALGIERLMALVELPESVREGYYVGAMCDEAIDTALQLTMKLRQKAKTSFEYTSKGFKSHMKAADKAQARYVLLIGEKELEEKSVWLKDLQAQEERTVSLEELEDLG